jgi:hypothetical protein
LWSLYLDRSFQSKEERKFGAIASPPPTFNPSSSFLLPPPPLPPLVHTAPSIGEFGRWGRCCHPCYSWSLIIFQEIFPVEGACEWLTMVIITSAHLLLFPSPAITLSFLLSQIKMMGSSRHGNVGMVSIK